MCSWFYLLLKTTVDYVMKKHINNNCHVLSFFDAFILFFSCDFFEIQIIYYLCRIIFIRISILLTKWVF
jgi:hypothetical protein